MSPDYGAHFNCANFQYKNVWIIGIQNLKFNDYYMNQASLGQRTQLLGHQNQYSVYNTNTSDR